MTIQSSVALRTTQAGDVATTLGANFNTEIRTGGQPANVATADTGTLLVTIGNCNLGTAASGAISMSGTPSTPSGVGAAAAGTGQAPGYFSMKTSGGTKVLQGTVGQQVALTTSALTSSGSAVLTFAATTGVVVGMNVAGTGVPAGAQVVAVTGTTVTLSMPTTGVASGAAITFSYDMTIDAAGISQGGTVTITSFTYTRAGA